jgi:hypothetical protein
MALELVITERQIARQMTRHLQGAPVFQAELGRLDERPRLTRSDDPYVAIGGLPKPSGSLHGARDGGQRLFGRCSIFT